MDVVYGIQVTGLNDRYITIAEEAVKMVGTAVLPGRFLVDLIPLCMCLRLEMILQGLTSVPSEIRAYMVSWSWISEVRGTLPKDLRGDVR